MWDVVYPPFFLLLYEVFITNDMRSGLQPVGVEECQRRIKCVVVEVF